MNRQVAPSASFLECFQRHDFLKVQQRIMETTDAMVQRSLAKQGGYDLEDLANLLSPAATPHLEAMAQKSQRLTQKRFGHCILLYIPLYLSNACHNSCLYCGFSRDNQQPRTTLSPDQIKAEIAVIKAMGFDHLLLVTGDSPKDASLSYLKQALEIAKPHFSQLSAEIRPLAVEEYQELISVGLNSVMLYQETYGPDYSKFHPTGKKADFNYRLEGPDRLGRAGIHKIGLGCLLGLDDWRTDSWFLGLHLSYLRKTYWRTKFSVSFPRLRPATGGMTPPSPFDDADLVQLILAYRLFDENLELSLSTRESPLMRDGLIKLGITTISAGSSTEPGGYSEPGQALGQFEIHDDRSPAKIVRMIEAQGYQALWKDWDRAYQDKPE